MRKISITGVGEVEVSGKHAYTGQPRPREQAEVCVSFREVWCSCDTELLESRYLRSQDSQTHTLGEATSALDRALETAFYSMTNEETAELTIRLPEKHVNLPDSVNFTCTSHLRIIENGKLVYELTPAEILGVALKYKSLGIALYKDGLPHKQIVAFFMFSDAVKWLCMIGNEEAGDVASEVAMLKTQCYNNIALFHLHQRNYRLCISAATTLLGVDGGNVKALYRRAVANTEMQNYEVASEDLAAALALDPNNRSVRKQQEVIKRKQKEVTDKYSAAMKKLFC